MRKTGGRVGAIRPQLPNSVEETHMKKMGCKIMNMTRNVDRRVGRKRK
jgi:hypothetical protein